MRNLLHLLAAGSFCLVLSIGSGCNAVKNKEKFAGDRESATLDGKDRSIEVIFKNDVECVTPPDAPGVATRIEGKKVTFTQTEDSPDDDDRTVTFTVKGAGEKQEAAVAITVARDPAVQEEDLEPSTETRIFHVDKDGAGELNFRFKKGMVGKVSVSPGMEGFSVHGAGQRLKIVASKASPGKYALEISARGNKKGAMLQIEIAGAPKIEHLAFKNLKENRIELKIPRTGSEALKHAVSIATGQPSGVTIKIADREAPSGLQAALSADRQTVNLTVSPEAAAGTYEVCVTGKDRRGQFDSQARFIVVLDNDPIGFKNLKDNKIVVAIPEMGDNARSSEVKFAAGEADSVSIGAGEGKATKGLKADLSKDRSAVIVTVGADASPGTYDVWVRGKQSGQPAKFTVVLPGITFKDLKDDKLAGRIPTGPAVLKIEAKIEAGEADKVFMDAREGVTATLANDRRSVIITVSSRAFPGSCEVWVLGKDFLGRVGKGKFTVVLK